VIVWKIDRFGRSLKHLVNALAELAALRVAFISLRDNLDLSTPSGRLMFQIIGAMAEFERALIQERVRAGIRNARAKVTQIAKVLTVSPLKKYFGLSNGDCRSSHIVESQRVFVTRSLQFVNGVLPLRAFFADNTSAQFTNAIFKSATRHCKSAERR